MNQLHRREAPLREAIVRANYVRLRPILMTTFSIVAEAAQRSVIAATIVGTRHYVCC
jgi:multidrug efflux pump subunit AcrB